MRRIALVLVFRAGLIALVLAQKTEIEAVNAKWVEVERGRFRRRCIPLHGRRCGVPSRRRHRER